MSKSLKESQEKANSSMKQNCSKSTNGSTIIKKKNTKKYTPQTEISGSEKFGNWSKKWKRQSQELKVQYQKYICQRKY